MHGGRTIFLTMNQTKLDRFSAILTKSILNNGILSTSNLLQKVNLGVS